MNDHTAKQTGDIERSKLSKKIFDAKKELTVGEAVDKQPALSPVFDTAFGDNTDRNTNLEKALLELAQQVENLSRDNAELKKQVLGSKENINKKEEFDSYVTNKMKSQRQDTANQIAKEPLVFMSIPRSKELKARQYLDPKTNTFITDMHNQPIMERYEELYVNGVKYTFGLGLTNPQRPMASNDSGIATIQVPFSLAKTLANKYNITITNPITNEMFIPRIFRNAYHGLVVTEDRTTPVYM